MSNKTVCDICGEELISGYQFKGKKISFFGFFTREDKGFRNFDICSSCIEDIRSKRGNKKYYIKKLDKKEEGDL